MIAFINCGKNLWIEERALTSIDDFRKISTWQLRNVSKASLNCIKNIFSYNKYNTSTTILIQDPDGVDISKAKNKSRSSSSRTLKF